jgi:hypothetical protein
MNVGTTNLSHSLLVEQTPLPGIRAAGRLAHPVGGGRQVQKHVALFVGGIVVIEIVAERVVVEVVTECLVVIRIRGLILWPRRAVRP